jgi:hypothetical protein
VRGLGAEPVVIDVYDAAALRDAVVAFRPDVVMHDHRVIARPWSLSVA